MDVPTGVEEFFSHYAAALSAVDLDALAQCYHYPSLAVSRLGCLAVTEPEQTRAFFAQNSARYHDQGIRAVRIGGLQPAYPVGDEQADGLWVGRAVLTNLDVDGVVVGVERHAYQLVADADGAWRIAVTTPLDAR